MPTPMGRGGKTVVLVLAALCVAALPASAGAAGGPQTGVINGLEAGQGTFPYMAFVLYEASGEGSLCSGTVVSSNVVLTAAHCVLNASRSAIRNPADFAVVTGNVNWTSPERTVSAVSRIAVAPNLAYLVPSYDIIRGDAAVLQLSQPISAPAVRLATSRVWGPGSGAVMVGWGLTQVSQPSPATLHFGETVIQGTEYCHSEDAYYETAQLICALDYPSEEWTTCHGDSGGPLLMVAPGTTNEALEIGITSFGQAGCSTEDAAYFTNVVAIASWVKGKIAEYAPRVPAPALAPAPPTTTASAPTFPRLTRGAAQRYTTESLSEGMPSRFRGRRGYRNSCKEVNKTKQKCFATWYQGETDYWGYVTIYYLLEAGKVVWDDHYTMKAVNDYCYYRSGHRASCPIRTFQG